MKVSKDFGLVIRRIALTQNSILLDEVMKQFNFNSVYDQNLEFISLGPFYGSDAANDCMKSLQQLGLVYIDDFFVLEAYFPEWCRVEVFANAES